MQVLTDRLGEVVASSLQLASPIDRVEKTDGQWWRYTAGPCRSMQLGAVPAHAMARMTFEDGPRIDMRWLEQIVHPPSQRGDGV